jgi:hypothetical protein
MHSELDGLSEPARRHVQLTRRFAAGLIAGPEFETAFLRMRTEYHEPLPAPLGDVMTEIFYGVDDYVSKENLRDPAKGDLDEVQLREIVRTQLRRLDET